MGSFAEEIISRIFCDFMQTSATNQKHNLREIYNYLLCHPNETNLKKRQLKLIEFLMV